jgi:CHAD domain-containing protein
MPAADSGYAAGVVTTAVRETGRKYEIADGAELPRWSGLSGADGLDGPEEQELEVVYYDTDGLRLAGAGVTLRRCGAGDESAWHLSLPLGDGRHDEVRVGDRRAGRRTRARAPRPPSELLALTRVFTRGAAVAPVAELSTARRRWRLTDGRGRLLVEVLDDRASARTLDASNSSTSWRELGVELGEHGDPGLLVRLERRLLDAGVRPSDAPPDLVRVLGDRLPASAPVPRPGRKAELADVVLAYLHEQAEAIHRGDPLVRQDVPDAVHKMRVATRRMRSALQAYGRVVDRAATRGLTDELKWLAGVLGTARDLEVLRARFTGAVDDVPDDLVLGPVRARFTRYFSGREDDAHRELVAVLDGDRYLALLDAIDALLADPPLTRHAHRAARRALPALVGRAHRRAARHMREADRHPQGPERDTELHEARKAAKRLRYATEAAVPVLGAPAEKLVKRVKDFQQLLGDHQDAVVARPVLREIAAQAHLDGENGFTYGLLHEQETGGTRLSESEVDDVWRALHRRARKLTG